MQIIPSTSHLSALASWNMGKNKCGQQLTCDLGNKCWATDLKLQKQWRLASGPGGIEKDIWYYKNIFSWIVSTDK